GRVEADIPASRRALQSPGRAPVDRSVEAAGRRRIHYLRLARIDHQVEKADADEGACREYRPRRAAVGRAVNARPEVVREISFTPPRVADFGIGRVESDRTRGEGRHLIGARGPGRPRVSALPDAAASRAAENVLGIVGIDGDARYAADDVHAVGTVGLPVR